MKTQLSKLIIGIAFLSPAMGVSQETKIQPCNTYAAMEAYFEANPPARAAYEETQKTIQKNYEEFVANQINNGSVYGKTSSLTDYTVPVVFHILHQYGSENIDDSVCIKAVQQMNRDYAREGADTNLIFKPFKDGTYAQTPAGYINSHIKFMLAHKDPQGNCTSGIVHHYDRRTYWSQDTLSYYNGITWPTNKYLNIIIVKNIQAQNQAPGTTLVGYTRLPGALGTANAADAIVYRYDYINGIAARSLSHEAGHWFGLAHTFGNTNNPGQVCGSTSGGDGIADTPDTKGNFGTCPQPNNAPNGVNTNSMYTCTSPASNGSYYQNIENFMDYSGCPKNFTTGQTNKMQSVIANGTAGRSNVVSAANLIATDVNGTGTCSLIADWASATFVYTVCSGGSLQVRDWSYNGIPVSWQWTAGNGATAASATSSVTNISFPTPGTTTVMLTVTNSQSVSSSLTRSVLVIDATPGITVPVTESFEGGLPTNWSVVNPNPSSAEWTATSDAGYLGTSSYYLPGATAGANQQDYLYMPILNMQNNPDKTFTFAYSYARASASQNDVLRVQVSNDCGGTWLDIANLGAATMANNTGGIVESSSPYFPSSSQEWFVYSISGNIWNIYNNSPNLLIRFNFTEGSTGGGNNLFIDAINLGGTVGLSELAKNLSLSLYPNPTNKEAFLEFNLADPSTIKINVLDVTGRVVLPVTNANFAPGKHSISINQNNALEQGIYFVNMNVNGKNLTQKLLIN